MRWTACSPAPDNSFPASSASAYRCKQRRRTRGKELSGAGEQGVQRTDDLVDGDPLERRVELAAPRIARAAVRLAVPERDVCGRRGGPHSAGETGPNNTDGPR